MGDGVTSVRPTRCALVSIAAEAGVSRPTVYRYFGDRDALVREAMVDTATRLRAAIQRSMAAHHDPATMLVEAVVTGLAEIPSEPVLRAVWDAASLDAVIVTNITDRAGRSWVLECLRPAIDLTGWSAVEAAEVLLRFVLSLLVSPAPRREPDQLRTFLQRRLLPSLGLAASDHPSPVTTQPPPGGTR